MFTRIITAATMIEDRDSTNEDILRKDEFKHSALGIHISKLGITFCIHPAHFDGPYSFTRSVEGAFSKWELFTHIKEFGAFVCKAIPSIEILATTYTLPGPIDGDSVTIPNFWASGDHRFTRGELSAFEFLQGRVSLINDVQALGHGLISTDEYYGLEDDFAPLWKPPAMDVMPTLYPLYFSSEAAAVLLVAFGLGAAFIVPIDSSDSYRVIASEGGHAIVQLCGPDEPGYEEEIALMKFIAERQHHAVEWEDICSTRGLAHCYNFELRGGQQAQSGEGVNAIAEIEQDPSDGVAMKALTTHFKFLMRFARMSAISFTCKSVFITYSVFAGGTHALQRQIALCRDEFMHFTKSEWVSNVSVFVQTTDRNISAMGVMYHAYLGLTRSASEEQILIDVDFA
jgi:glucokinase